jgi:hypothetical protein
MSYSVNDIVRVVNVGYQYDTYGDWAKEHGFYAMWVEKDKISTSDSYVVRVAAPHNKKTRPDQIIYGIENIRTHDWHIISDDGLRMVSKAAGSLSFGIDDSLFEL